MSWPARNSISSAFSLNMLPLEGATCIDAYPISVAQATEIIGAFENSWEMEFSNYVNPEHRSTCALVALLTGKACQGGLASVQDGDQMVVILPPREFANRSGDEIEVTDLDLCQFWHLKFSHLD